MKLNMDIVKKVLEYIEENQKKDQPVVAQAIRIKECDPEDIYYAIRLLDGAGYLLCYAGEQYRKEFLPSKDMNHVYIQRLTWKGHEFLADTKEPAVWDRAKHVAGHFSLKVFSKILREVAVQYARSQLGF